MSILYLYLIAALIVGMTWWLGSWNIFINLINFFIAALVASSFFESLAGMLESFDTTYRYFIDFVAIWLLFFITFGLLRLVTDFLTVYQMQMNFWVELPLRTILSLWLAGGFICFTFFTLHLAPLPPENYSSSPQTKLFGFGPDRMWAAFIQSRSRGALSESKNGLFLSEYDLDDHPDDVGLNCRVFDPFAQFGEKGVERRQQISQNETLRAY